MKSVLSFSGLFFVLVACAPESTVTLDDDAQARMAEVQTAEIIEPSLLRSDIRPEVGGVNGAVVSGHPLASQLGYEVLRNGGNAVDAAVTMAAALAVVRPHMNSVGGDVFSLFYEAATGQVTALNASGRAGAVATPAFFLDQGMTRVPFTGPGSITVPGAVSAWAEALTRYGTLSFAEALQPAIELAEKGFMVSSTLAEDLAQASERLNPEGQQIYRPGGQALQAGELLRNPALAQSLTTLAAEGPSAMYGGSIGAALAAFVEQQGGHLRLSDFASHNAEWVDPISMNFRGKTIYTMPPNSQGLVLLQMMAMADTLPFEARSSNQALLLHELAEITKIAFADRDRWVADPAFADVPVQQLLDEGYLKQRAALIGERATPEHAPGFGGMTTMLDEVQPAATGDTVYLMVVDAQGNAVSWIQSIFGSFGSNLVEPRTGIVLHNRGAGFSLEPGHPNLVQPGKRPFHTLMTALLTNEQGLLEMTVGTPGGGGQPQFVMQALLQSLIFGMSPQAAVESPRFRSGAGVTIDLETRFPELTLEQMTALGYDVEPVEGWTSNFGSVKMIQRLPNGVLRTGADMRREGAAMAF